MLGFLSRKASLGEQGMKALNPLVLVTSALFVSATAASANDRVTHAAVGAVAGAVVAGPIGFVGGGLVGYLAGRQIGCDLGVERSGHHVRYRRPGTRPPAASRRVEH